SSYTAGTRQSAPNSFTYHTANLTVGAQTTFCAVVRPTVSGFLRATAFLSGGALDLNLSNNLSTVFSHVGGALDIDHPQKWPVANTYLAYDRTSSKIFVC